MKTNVSIIVPTLNEENQIGDCLDSALATQPWQIIVADGGSSDRTVEIASARDVQVISSEKGRAAQQNAGATLATGDILLFLHADCRLPFDALDQITKAAAGRKTVTGAFRQRINESGLLYRLLEWGNALRVTWLATPYGDQAIFMSHKLWQDVGGFPDLPIMEDLQLMYRLGKTIRPRLLDGPLIVDARRWKKNGVLRQTLQNWSLVFAWSRGVSTAEISRRYPVCTDSTSKSAEKTPLAGCPRQ